MSPDEETSLLERKGQFYDWAITNPDRTHIERVKNGLKVPPWVASFVVNRGFSTPELAMSFLNVRLDALPNPDLLVDMQKAVKRLSKAIDRKESIVIFGDYDVDGITGTTILTDFIRNIGGNVCPFIPNRFKHGYGLNSDIIRKLAEQGMQLLVSVDCGIGNIREVETAQGLGIDTIITDHHELGDRLPPALSILNPHRNEKDSSFSYLAGVGVVFYLTIALRKQLREEGYWRDKKEPDLRDYLDLVTLGTIADQVPLLGINRILVKYGLTQLKNSQHAGIQSLLKVCKIKDKVPGVWEIGFLLAPRINAAGRMGYEGEALKLLLGETPEESFLIAKRLDQLNRERQEEESRILEEALQIIHEDEKLCNTSSLVLAMEDWNRGIIGIVASRLVDKFGKPAILLARNGPFWEGSARSVSGFDVHKALTACSEHLRNFGGHKMAAGLKLDVEKLNEFQGAFEKVASETIPRTGVRKRLNIDATVKLEDISSETMEYIEKLSPFGIGNPRPVFMLESFETKSRKVMKDKHLFLQLKQGKQSMSAVGFNLVDEEHGLPSSFNALVFYPVYNHWQGQTSIELRILDFC